MEVCPVSDGGDGFGSVIARAEGAEKRTAKVKDAFFGETEAEYHIINGDAYVESARACGLRFGKDVMRATSYGVGQLIYSAAVNGAKNIYVGLGGSGTNDGGCGFIDSGNIMDTGVKSVSINIMEDFIWHIVLLEENDCVSFIHCLIRIIAHRDNVEITKC